MTRHHWGGDPSGPTDLHVIDGQVAVLEQAKGALMLRFGIGSYPAFALLVRWAHVNNTSPQVVAQTLLRGICQGEKMHEPRRQALVDWLGQQMQDTP